MGEQHVKNLFCALKTQISATDHQQRGDGLWREILQRQQARQQNDQLVLQRSFGNAVDDRQFAVCLKAMHVFGRHSRVINDHTCGFHARFASRRRDIVDRRRRHFGNRRHIIQQRQ